MKVLKYFTWLPHQEITSNGDTHHQGIYVAGTEKIILFIDISSVSGTDPTLDLYIDIYDPILNEFIQLAHVGTFTGTGVTMHPITVEGGQAFSLRWVVGGTNPSFWITITAEFRGD